MIELDGSVGEGGGQILRTALSLSTVTGAPFRIGNIRAGRERPGILRQHRTAIEAAATICGAEVEAGRVGDRELVFSPGKVRAGRYAFSIGTAGSTTLVLQTILPALVTADGPSTVTLQGGTHNPWSPPFEFLQLAFLPLLARMGPCVDLTLERAGFHPAGGGLLRAEITPAPALAPLELEERGRLQATYAVAVVANLPAHIGEREIATACRALGWREEEGDLRVVDSDGPGNAFLCVVEARHVTGVFTAFGRKGVPAEKVAREAVRDVRSWLKDDVPVDPHLADQLMVPLALAGAGSYRTGPLTAHAKTNLDVIAAFDVPTLRVEEIGPRAVRVAAGP